MKLKRILCMLITFASLWLSAGVAHAEDVLPADPAPVSDFMLLVFCVDAGGQNTGTTTLTVTANGETETLTPGQTHFFTYDNTGTVLLNVFDSNGTSLFPDGPKTLTAPAWCSEPQPTATFVGTKNCDGTISGTLTIDRDGMTGDFSFGLGAGRGAAVSGNTVDVVSQPSIDDMQLFTPTAVEVLIMVELHKSACTATATFTGYRGGCNNEADLIMEGTLSLIRNGVVGDFTYALNDGRGNVLTGIVAGTSVGFKPLWGVSIQVFAPDGTVVPVSVKIDKAICTGGSPWPTPVVHKPTASFDGTQDCLQRIRGTLTIDRDGMTGDFSFTLHNQTGRITGDSVDFQNEADLDDLMLYDSLGNPFKVTMWTWHHDQCELGEAPVPPTTTVPDSVLFPAIPIPVTPLPIVTTPVATVDTLPPVATVPAPDFATVLPATGSSSWSLVWAALLLLAVGFALIAVSKRRMA